MQNIHRSFHFFRQADHFKFSQLLSMAVTKSATVSDMAHTPSLLWTGMWNIKKITTFNTEPKAKGLGLPNT